MEKNNPRTLFAWASYDWANSAYNLAITVSIFPAYYESVVRANFGNPALPNGKILVPFLGFLVESGALYSYTLSLSFLIACVLSPMLAGVADVGGKKKVLMQFFTYLGASACAGLFLFTGENITWGISCVLLASLGFAGSLVFYVSYLPEIATPDRWDNLSARGFSAGFLGSVIHLVVSLGIILNAGALGITDGTLAPRISFLLVSIWWVGFAQIAFFYLPNSPRKTEHSLPLSALFLQGFQELNRTWQSLKDLPNVKQFLAGFFFYSMGAQTILLLATLFGAQVLKLETQELIFTTLLLQVVGIMGAYLIAYISNKVGNKNALIGMVMIWTVIAICGYFVQDKLQFYMIASAVGVVMGAIHISRSTYAKLLPENTTDTTSYFSFYDVVEKMSIVGGTFTFGLLSSLLDMRSAIIALSIYFVIGLIILFGVKMEKKL